ncbi:5-methyltetrahydropteroyltriglutamate--homocysteine S-methyltransferase [Maridesulfovibrio bastinii]|uniref:5-methyltetrahydropteroyltriglutamate-- homocysteine S-methyltransferase n=1 Tax=Maridesulfovibrio bastinii TaxID=47157 RepID=UPI0003FD5A3C|nr:5-methyltetrahydropteroyltriglutamate--homocysteine S-methyltransferase [Maridesulfovibrio bastinii]
MLTHTLGFPRMGGNRELKKALESYWKEQTSKESLLKTAADLRKQNWTVQHEAGIDLLPVGDFSLYDHILDNSFRFGVVPERYVEAGYSSGLSLYFAMARGEAGEGGVQAMEMTKWFDTNYHYIVPEFTRGQKFYVADNSIVDQVREAKAAGFTPKAVLPGPLTFLSLGKSVKVEFNKFDLLPGLVEAYIELLKDLSKECSWIQLDEPVLATDLDEELKDGFKNAYAAFRAAVPDVKLMIANYFGTYGENLELATSLPVDALHADLVRGCDEFERLLELVSPDMAVSLGVVDGRNVWKTNLDNAVNNVRRAVDTLGSERVLAGSSCSLLHSPVDLDYENKIDPEIKSWLAFARQKCVEIGLIAKAVNGEDISSELLASRKAQESRRKSPRVHNPAVTERIQSLNSDDYKRQAPYSQRAKSQRNNLGLPLLPTTTIGSFPQTHELRALRRKYKDGQIDVDVYEGKLKEIIKDCINRQEKIGLDLLVHGEPERNDMVEYFGEQLDGYCFTENGWVQSYGSRCVKPPVIFGDISRPEPMTVKWIQYARSVSSREVKGMLTGPVTMLCWSFVRDDQPRSETCRQLALAIRDEVADLEAAGVKAIQIDEPALGEGLPLRISEQDNYLKWAVACFRLASTVVRNETQIHTHMCYCDFGKIISSIADLDADVISMEASRSDMELLHTFSIYNYPNEVGPGIYDIHSPRIPSADEMAELLSRAMMVIPRERLWVNPDCGLKTREWPEAEASLENMVKAAEITRKKIN